MSYNLLRDSAGLQKLLDGIANEILAHENKGAKLRLIGVRTRGVILAQRLAPTLSEKLGRAVPVGAVDITLYRDDLDEVPRWPILHGTDIPFTVDDADIVLVDDVLYTGRTVRAAINAICDLGRPSRIRLAVAVDRNLRELPIAADIFGMIVPDPKLGPVHVKVKEIDGVDEIIQVVKHKHHKTD